MCRVPDHDLQPTNRPTVLDGTYVQASWLQHKIPVLFFRHVVLPPSVPLISLSLSPIYPLSPDRCFRGTKGNKVMERNNEPTRGEGAKERGREGGREGILTDFVDLSSAQQTQGRHAHALPACASQFVEAKGTTSTWQLNGYVVHTQ